jgi:microcin C transport system ATP-binding protein
MRGIRGSRIGMIFQEPMTALNPLFTVGNQIGEVLTCTRACCPMRRARAPSNCWHAPASPSPQAHRRLPAPAESGGQRQRAMIAMALACKPELLICDEPTTALDVTIQAQILSLLDELQAEMGMAMLFITHDLNLVRRFTHRVGVMERGRLVESGATAEVFGNPQHPYTKQAAGQPAATGGAAGGWRRADAAAREKACDVSFDFSEGWFGKRQFVAVKDATLAAAARRNAGHRGRVGSGKTTLGMALLALQPISGGRSCRWATSASTTPTASTCAPCAGACRWCSRTRLRRCRRA